jgi:hypothetical protein
MKYIVPFCAAVLLSVNVFSQAIEKDFPESFKVKISNPLKVARESVLIVLSPDQIKKGSKKFNNKAFVVMDGVNIPNEHKLSFHIKQEESGRTANTSVAHLRTLITYVFRLSIKIIHGSFAMKVPGGNRIK